MKTNVMEFIRRGMAASGFGPLVLVVLYLVQQNLGLCRTLTVNEVCLGILSLSALAFIAGGLTMLYQIEQLPLAVAILIHGCTLYVSYLITYLINGWLAEGITPILVFTAIFVLGYLAVWAVIFTVSRNNTRKLNALLKEKQQFRELHSK